MKTDAQKAVKSPSGNILAGPFIRALKDFVRARLNGGLKVEVAPAEGWGFARITAEGREVLSHAFAVCPPVSEGRVREVVASMGYRGRLDDRQARVLASLWSVTLAAHAAGLPSPVEARAWDSVRTRGLTFFYNNVGVKLSGRYVVLARVPASSQWWKYATLSADELRKLLS